MNKNIRFLKCLAALLIIGGFLTGCITNATYVIYESDRGSEEERDLSETPEATDPPSERDFDPEIEPDMRVIDAGPIEPIDMAESLDMADLVDFDMPLSCSSVCNELISFLPESSCDYITLDASECENACESAHLDDFVTSLYQDGEVQIESIRCDFIAESLFSCEAKCSALLLCENGLSSSCPTLFDASCVERCQGNPEEFSHFGPQQAHCEYFATQSAAPICGLCERKCEELRGCSSSMELLCPEVVTNDCEFICERYPDEFRVPNVCQSFSDNPRSQSCGHCAATSEDASTPFASLEHGIYLRGRSGISPELTERRVTRGRLKVCQVSALDTADCDYFYDEDALHFDLILAPRIDTSSFLQNVTAVPAYRGRVELHLENIVRVTNDPPDITIQLLGIVLPEQAGPGSAYSGFWWESSFVGAPNISTAKSFASSFAIRHGFLSTGATDSYTMRLNNLSGVSRFTIVLDHLSLRSPNEHNSTCVERDGCFPNNVESFCDELCSPTTGLMECVDSESCALKLGSAWNFGDQGCNLDTEACRAHCLQDACDIIYHLDYIKDANDTVSHLWVRNWNFTDQPAQVSEDLDCCLCGQASCDSLNMSINCEMP